MSEVPLYGWLLDGTVAAGSFFDALEFLRVEAFQHLAEFENDRVAALEHPADDALLQASRHPEPRPCLVEEGEA
eukprot:CAMPEP_0180163394 /NCGR_PEP_ID=MMETSP0986-20121125/29779_1 /TAXON_ID=697907 /ORGANISM="non described non described, Strain CCMP2293" /LENGTH=73 /DNA_ID=CAMNT_0022114033 /DNA_START=75 /DNA_END=293 /DNA_ORIENTATION=+